MPPKEKTKKELREDAINTLVQKFEPSVVLQYRPYTCVKMDINLLGIVHTGVGFTKVCWPDKWDEQYGLDLATRKAASVIVRKITKNKSANLKSLIRILKKEN